MTLTERHRGTGTDRTLVLPSRAVGTVVGDIALQRAADVGRELGEARYDDIVRLADRASIAAPRPVALALAAPGLHVIAEVKRSSPSAGELAAATDDPAARARAYAAGGAAIISVLCEPHRFGGSVDDLRVARAGVSIPVLAKEFVVDERQLPLLRGAGADAVLLLAVLHPRARLARLVRLALDLRLEPLVEVHDERELDAALATETRLVGINNRDLRSLAVDPELVVRLRGLVPDDRIVVGESGVREPAMLAGWRAVGVDAALIGESLMRSPNPASAVASFVAAGRVPDDPASLDRVPAVKICGVTRPDDVLAAVAAGADAIGLNLVPGTPRALGIDEAAALARLARSLRPASASSDGLVPRAAGDARPRIVIVTVDIPPDELATAVAAIDPDAVQLNGNEPVAMVSAVPRPAWKVLHLPPECADDPLGMIAEASGAVVERGRAYLAAGTERLLLDTAGGPYPGGTGRRAAIELSAAIAREIPVTLAGGLSPSNVSDALRSIPAMGVDVASGVEAPQVPGERPHKEAVRVALFAKRARGARVDLPVLAARPTPVHPGLLEADAAGRWGVDRAFGGRYVPETLMAALEQLEAAYAALRRDPRFWAELRELLARYAGRPTPLYRADHLAEEVLEEARRLAAERDGSGDATRAVPPRAAPTRAAPAPAGPAGTVPTRLRLYLKREDLAHTGAHKINNALGQTLLTRRLGKSRVIAETGAGQHGVATATACALLGLPCVVYMGAEDIERQRPNVLRMHALGAEVRPVTSGSATLKDAVNEAMRDWVTNVETTHYVLGSAMGPHPYPTIVRDLQRVIGDEAAAQLAAIEGRLPDLALACVGGGSNAIGLLSRFIGEPDVRLAVAEAAGDGIPTGRHAAALAGGTPGILHGSRSLMLQDADGQVVEAHSISAGLDYPGVGPQISALFAAGRLEIAPATDADAIAAMKQVTRAEGILPALETSHAFAVLPRLLAGTEGSGEPYPDECVVLLGLSGRGDKDLATLERWEAAR